MNFQLMSIKLKLLSIERKYDQFFINLINLIFLFAEFNF
jgi:hypothetical protein